MAANLTIPRNGDWRHRYAFFDAVGAPEDVSAALCTVVMRHQATQAEVVLSEGQGLAEPDADHVKFVSVDRVAKQGWAKGQWAVEIQLAWPDGFEEVAAVDTVSVTEFGAVAEASSTHIQRQPDTTRLVRVATGPAGPKGLPGGTLTKVAVEPLSGHRIVKAVDAGGAGYPDITDAADGEMLLGITTGAAAPGGAVSILFAGPHQDPSWSWTPGPLFCGQAGELVQAPPGEGAFVRQVGFAVAADRIVIDFRPPIYSA